MALRDRVCKIYARLKGMVAPHDDRREMRAIIASLPSTKRAMIRWQCTEAMAVDDVMDQIDKGYAVLVKKSDGSYAVEPKAIFRHKG